MRKYKYLDQNNGRVNCFRNHVILDEICFSIYMENMLKKRRLQNE